MMFITKRVHVIQKRYVIAHQSFVRLAKLHLLRFLWSWDDTGIFVITSTIKCGGHDLASQTGYTYLPIFVEYVDGIQHPSPPVDWILDISPQPCIDCTPRFYWLPCCKWQVWSRCFHPQGVDPEKFLGAFFGAFGTTKVTFLVVQDSVVSYWCFFGGLEVKDDVILNGSFLHFKLGPDGKFWEM